MVRFLRRLATLHPRTPLARLCPQRRFTPWALVSLFLSLDCASSADRQSAALSELASLRAAEKTPKMECRPGTVASCFEGDKLAAGRGICKDGEKICNPQGQYGPCKGQVLPKARELCNGLDDDCNGTIDDGFERIGTACTVGKGQCQGQGVYTCRADKTAADCSARRKDASPEICDGLDNDCDGEIDEMDTKDNGEPCDTGKLGVCAKGRTQCRAGRTMCVPLRDPTHEVCNRRDDNCNGRVDDNCTPQ